MRSAVWIFTLLIAVPTMRAGDIDMSVFLWRDIGPSFRSIARAQYMNDLGGADEAALSGTHKVTGPQVFQTPVNSSNGYYSYDLEGPAEAGACYTTDLHVVADPYRPGSTITRDASGPETVCLVVPAPPPPPPNPNACGQTDPYCTDPLVLDLNGDGIHTTAMADAVWFDLDGDGLLEETAWTDPSTDEGFLYLDRDHKGQVTDGRELFGVGTVMPDGSRGHDGFTALATYDLVEHGGSGDGLLSADDDVWNRLRLWVDRDHNGICDPNETGTLHSYGVREIDLSAVQTATRDAAGNAHVLTAVYRRRESGKTAKRLPESAIEAIGFQRAQ